MGDELNEWVIRIADYTRDPVDDSAYGVVFDIIGPGNFSEMVRASFAENFIKSYFRVPWFKDLAEEEPRIFKKYHDFFVRLALVRVEEWLLRGAAQEDRRMMVDDDGKSLDWARAIEEGRIKPKSTVREGADGSEEYRLVPQ
jgi:hypothetical protein